MKKIFPILLMGILSMLFGEVFAGSSQTWFLDGWGVLLTYPLYLMHVMFFLWIAFKTRKTSINQLYILGIMFGLYEALITKVLWAGYMDQAGPTAGTLMGVGLLEFPILVFFWHPVMSFIMPVLIYQIITGRVLKEHSAFLERSKMKTLIMTLGIIAFTSFIASGNQMDLAQAFIAFAGTGFLAYFFLKLSKKPEISVFSLSKKGFVILCVLLGLLYAITTAILLPERLPLTYGSYLTIIGMYIIAIFLFWKSKMTSYVLLRTNELHYSGKHLMLFSAFAVIMIAIWTSNPDGAMTTLIGSYFLATFIGLIMFVKSIAYAFRR